MTYINSRLSCRDLRTWRRNATALALFLCVSVSVQGANVLTYHNDISRTGWNPAETSLTSSVVGSSSFGLRHQITLDAQIDAQPLVVANFSIGGAVRNVVYVATEGNTVYAIDAASGAILLQRNLGTPAPLPAVCPGTGTVGINSTPVINRVAKTLYVIAYVSVSGTAEYYLHALNLKTLADTQTPVLVSASHTLADGMTTYNFNAGTVRQRAALLNANGSVYAGFAGFCETTNKSARGWLLGWNAASLAPLTSYLGNQVLPNNAPNDFFLTAIWMSGYGPSAAPSGSVFFVTGNSDPSGTTYDRTGAINLSESVVEWSPSQGKVVSYFSPTDSGADVTTLDRQDLDFGAGGVMLLPKQPGAAPHLAVAAGKVGIMYLMKQGALGGENSGKVLGEYEVGRCWCGPSYFTGSDGVGRVVSSGGSNIIVWKVQTSPTTSLQADAAFTSPSIATGQKPGFFTSISSNGTTAGSAIIWAVNRPAAGSTSINLFAFDASSGAQLFSATAGTWPQGGNANIVPTVANGNVYVASLRTLSIFGVASPGQTVSPDSALARPADPPDSLSVH
jgi:hypothetical protein